MALKVLMYGWEFPPRISGGLGTACHAIVKELVKKKIDLTLVLPHAADVSDIDHINLINCENLLIKEETELEETVKVKYADIALYLHPYISAKEFKRFFSNETLQNLFALLSSMHLPEEIKDLARAALDAQNANLHTTGSYGFNLLVEVFHYALLAGALAKDVEHDVIYAHDWLTMLAALEAKRFSHKPVVLHVHALETDRSGFWVNKKIFAIEKYGMQQADQIIAVSQYTKNNIVQYYGISPEKIKVVYNGVYCDKTAVSTEHSRPKMVLFVGRMTQQKGPYFFIEIARRVLEERSDVQFVLAGSGDLLTEMIEKAAHLRIGKNVHFLGFLDSNRVKEIYQLADVYVMPSVSEPFGLSALEAISYDVPVVITKQSGVAEVLHNALTSDFWDVEDMAAKILALLEYPALHHASLAAGKKCLQDITWGRAAEKIIKVYSEVIKK